MKKLFIATSSFYRIGNKFRNYLKKKNFSIKFNPYKRKLKEDELINLAHDANYIIAGTENYNSKVINKLSKLQHLFRLGSGTDNIDLDLLYKKKIKFSKSKITPEIAVAELIVGYIFSLYRDIYLHNYNLKNNIWSKKMGFTLNGKILGIIGYGKIGKYLKKILKNFKVKFLIYDKKKRKNNNSSLTKLIKNSDIISLNVSLLNKDLILDKKNLKMIKKNSIVINTSRSEILDYEYLYNLLKKKKILGAALDVFPKEPYHGKFSKLNNVILTPHIGSYAKEIRVRMEEEAISKIISS